LQAETAARHPWEVARAKAVEGILARHRSRFATVLDYGCGDGFTGERVQDAFGVPLLMAVDVYLPEVSCGVAPRGAGTVERSRDPRSLVGRRFDLILLCDVIEHVEDDVGLLNQLRGDHLVPDGLVMVTVPAFQALFSDHDRFLRHHRRYTLSGLRDVLGRAGLTPVQDGYLFGSLLPARAAATLIGERGSSEAREHGIGGWRRGPVVTRALTTALSVDNAIMLAARGLGITLPGLTAWALCRTS
jgi:SAM-dependent methyltransferase